MNPGSERPGPAAVAGLEVGGGLRLRPQDAGDADFLLRLFAETHGASLLLAPLDDARRLALLRSQAELHEAAVADAAGALRRWIVERAGEGQDELPDGSAIGRLALGERGEALYLADLALLVEVQGQGIGARLVEAVKREAGKLGRPLLLNARRDGRALALYLRLGFRVEADSGELSLPLRWSPAPDPGPGR